MGPRRKVMFPFFGDGIFTQEGESWKHSRELLRRQFNHGRYEGLGIFCAAVDSLIDVMPKEGIVDLQPFFFRLTLDTTTAFLFGESVDSLRTSNCPTGTRFASAFSTAQDYIAKRMRLGDLYWLIGGGEFRKACNDIHQFADEIIDRNLDCGDEQARYVFLNAIAKDTQDRTTMRSHIINALVAGRDTTACLLSWTFFLLVRYPNVLERVRAEVASTYQNDSVVTQLSLRKMKYLHNVLKEVLRLYPPVPVNSRTSVRTTILPVGGGYNLKSPVLVSKGTAVAWSVYAMHRRPDLYGMDAEQFRPERWYERMPLQDDLLREKWGYLPFNGGPRACLGEDFAMAQVAYTVVRLLQHFPVVRLPLGEKVELIGEEKQTMTLVLSITEGCKVALS